MVNIVKILTIAAIAGVSIAAPTSTTATASSSASSSSSSAASPSATGTSSGNSTSSAGGGGGGVTVTVKNNCGKDLQVNMLTNGGGGSESQQVSSGSSYDFQVGSNWGGRFWACEDGDQNCDQDSSAVSLAEFLFKGSGGNDFYDISFVDGFNLPLSISPEGGKGGSCGSPTCASLPQCPDELKTDGGACKSACAAFNTDEYCCRGEYNSPDKCKASQYADQFKAGCKDAYSYAYDDKTSTFSCQSDKYTVIFCPSGSD